MTRPPETETTVSQAFQLRHPLLAMAVTLIKRRPIAGTIVALLIVVSSTILLEVVGLGNAIINAWEQTNIIAPKQSEFNVAAMNRGAQEVEARRLHEGVEATIARPMTFYGVAGGDRPPTMLPSESSAGVGFDTGSDPDVFTRQPQHETPGTSITPLYLANGDLATYRDYAVVWDGKQWGLVPLAEYNAAGLPARNLLQ